MDSSEDFGGWAQKQLETLEKEDHVLAEQAREIGVKRSRLASQIAELRAAATMYLRWRSPNQRPSIPVGESKGAYATPTMTIADIAAAVMRDQGGQAAARQLIDVLRGAGKLTGSDDRTAYNVVAATLDRQRDRFKKVGRGVWGLTNKLLPAAPNGNSEP